MEQPTTPPEYCPECWRSSWGGEICRKCIEEHAREEAE